MSSKPAASSPVGRDSGLVRNVPRPGTTEALLKVVTACRLVEPARLQEYLRSKGGVGRLPADPAAGADDLVRAGVLTRFQADHLLAGNSRRLTVGRYVLLEQLGVRGASSVFLGEKRPGGKRLALKLLPVEEGAGTATVERFRREAQALAKLNHPNIVHINDFDELDGHLVLMMEYVEGESLAALVQKGPLSPAEAARIVHAVALALEEIHQAGLVHRDIKPSHLMRDRNGAVKLLDFGVARFLDERVEPLTMKFEAGKVLGSVEYLAPEQVADSHDVDIRADIYGLGATFYFLLTGRAPFDHKAILRRAAGVVTHAQPLAQLRPDVPRELTALLDRMMAIEPAARFQIPRELAEALGHWLETAPPPKVPSSSQVGNLPPTRPRSAEKLATPSGRAVAASPVGNERESWVSGWGVILAVFAGSLAFFLALMNLWQR